MQRKITDEIKKTPNSLHTFMRNHGICKRTMKLRTPQEVPEFFGKFRQQE